MPERFEKYVAYTSFAFMTFICTLIVCRWVVEFVTWTSVDSGWAQTIGSILAICAAIWIAHRDARKKNDAELAIALIAAVKMSQGATALRVTLYAVKVSTENLLTDQFNIGNLRAVKGELDQAPHWSVEDVAQLSPLPDRCALHLARAHSAIHDARLHVDISIGAAASVTQEQMVKRAELTITIISRAIEHLDVALRSMNNSLGDGHMIAAMERAEKSVQESLKTTQK